MESTFNKTQTQITLVSDLSEDYDYFMQLDVSPYEGQWIGICDKKVISHAKSFKEAYQEAKKICGTKRPFLALIPSDDTWIL